MCLQNKAHEGRPLEFFIMASPHMRGGRFGHSSLVLLSRRTYRILNKARKQLPERIHAFVYVVVHSVPKELEEEAEERIAAHAAISCSRSSLTAVYIAPWRQAPFISALCLILSYRAAPFQPPNRGPANRKVSFAWRERLRLMGICAPLFSINSPGSIAARLAVFT